MPLDALNIQQSGSTLNASASAQDLFRYTIPAGMLGPNKRIRFAVDGLISTAVSLLPTITMTLIFGSQSYSVASGITLLASLANSPWSFVGLVMIDTNASQFSTAQLNERFSILNATTPRMSANTAFTQNATTALDIALQVTFSGVSVGTTIQRKEGIVELIA